MPATYSEKTLLSNAGRCEGGLACIWKKDLPFEIKVLILDKDYIALQLSVGDLRILLINVYMRSVTWEGKTLDEYLQGLHALEYVLINYDLNSVYILGDFNADPFMSRAWNHFNHFCEKNYLSCMDFKLMDSSSFTFILYNNSYCKWLDHIVGRNSKDVCVNDVKILYELVGSDHLPMVGNIHLENVTNVCNTKKEKDRNRFYIAWKKLSADDFSKLFQEIDNNIRGIMPCEATKCCSVGCQNEYHLAQLDDIYMLIVNNVLYSSGHYAKQIVNNSTFKVIPGWNRHVKELYSKSREDYKKWLVKGRVRDSDEFRKMNMSRKVFKEALSLCKNNETDERSISIQEKFINKNMNEFWNEVKQQSNKVKWSSVIDGENDTEKIINIFTGRFLNGDNNDCDIDKRDEENLLHNLKEVWHQKKKFTMTTSPETLKKVYWQT